MKIFLRLECWEVAYNEFLNENLEMFNLIGTYNIFEFLNE